MRGCRSLLHVGRPPTGRDRWHTTVLLKRLMGAPPQNGGVHVDERIRNAATGAVAALLRNQQAAGEHSGCVVVAAFLRGELIVHAWTGPGAKADSLVMPASVAKGCTAAALAVLHCRGLLDYTMRVSSLWPGFERNGKGGVTVEQAISHRAGLCTSLPGPRVALAMLYAFFSRGWRAKSDVGVAWAARLRPQWPPGSWAAYHPVSWSWLVIGIAAGCSGGLHIRDLFAEHVAIPLASATDMFLGVLPTHERRRLLRQVRPSVVRLWHSTASKSVNLLVRLVWLFVAWLEALIMTTIFNNFSVFAAVCLPSSNGYWTALAVARLYAALVNAGSVQLPNSSSSVQLLDASKLEALLLKIRTDARVPSSEGDATAMNSLGFSPWPSLGAPTDSLVLGHGGMGGSVAWADVDRGLSVVVLRTTYHPVSLGACAATRELCECIRAHALRDA